MNSKKAQSDSVQEKLIKESKKSLSIYSLQLFDLNSNFEPLSSVKRIDHNLQNEISSLTKDSLSQLRGSLKITKKVVDALVFSGVFETAFSYRELDSFALKLYEAFSEGDFNEEVVGDFFTDCGICPGYEKSSHKIQKYLDELDIKTTYRLLNKYNLLKTQEKESLKEVLVKDFLYESDKASIVAEKHYTFASTINSYMFQQIENHFSNTNDYSIIKKAS